MIQATKKTQTKKNKEKTRKKCRCVRNQNICLDKQKGERPGIKKENLARISDSLCKTNRKKKPTGNDKKIEKKKIQRK